MPGTPIYLGSMFICNCIGKGAFNPPYPPSQVITGLTWDEDVVKLVDGAGDNWPITWVDDDLQITSYGDGKGFSDRTPRLTLGMAKVFGDPPDHYAEDLVSDADAVMGGGSSGIKSSGLLIVDDVLYMFVRNYKPPNSDDYTNARLALSNDMGVSWDWADWHFSDTFGCPEFIQFGKNYQNARDNYVYIVSQANDDAYKYSPDIVMLRAPKERVAERNCYEFFAGLGAHGSPVWSSDIAERKSIFTDPKGTQRIAINHNAALQRYILTTTHQPPGSDATHTPALGIFDAPEPWGPWTTVYYSDEWSENYRTYHQKFPTKWMSDDGKTMWLLFSGLDGGYYSFCLRKASLEIAVPDI